MSTKRECAMPRKNREEKLRYTRDFERYSLMLSSRENMPRPFGVSGADNKVFYIKADKSRSDSKTRLVHIYLKPIKFFTKYNFNVYLWVVKEVVCQTACFLSFRIFVFINRKKKMLVLIPYRTFISVKRDYLRNCLLLFRWVFILF